MKKPNVKLNEIQRKHFKNALVALASHNKFKTKKSFQKFIRKQDIGFGEALGVGKQRNQVKELVEWHLFDLVKKNKKMLLSLIEKM